MDPNITLKLAAEALDDGDFTEAQQHLNNYQRWRDRHGHEPNGGDALKENLQQRLREKRKRR